MTESPRYQAPPTNPSSADGPSTSDVAKDRAADVKDSAKDAGARVADTAKDQAAQVAGEAKDQARDLLSQGRTELTDQAQAQQQRAAGSLHALSSQLHEMSANASEPGLAQDLTGQVAGHAASLATWLEDREPGAVLEEVRQYARRRPGTFLALCAGAGVLAGRMGRGLQADATDNAGDSGTVGSTVGSATGTADGSTHSDLAGNDQNGWNPAAGTATVDDWTAINTPAGQR